MDEARQSKGRATCLRDGRQAPRPPIPARSSEPVQLYHLRVRGAARAERRARGPAARPRGAWTDGRSHGWRRLSQAFRGQGAAFRTARFSRACAHPGPCRAARHLAASAPAHAVQQRAPAREHRDLLPDESSGPLVDMAETVRCGWVELWYQPKIDARAVIMRGVEAFLRIRHPVWGIVPPAYLVPSDGDPRFAPLSESVISRAVEDWYYFFAQRGPIETAINLPMAFLQEPGSISRLCRQLPDNAAFDGLIVEINGAEPVKNLNIAKEIRHRLCGGPAEAVDLPPYPRPRRRLWSTHRRRGGRDLGGFPRRT